MAEDHSYKVRVLDSGLDKLSKIERSFFRSNGLNGLEREDVKRWTHLDLTENELFLIGMLV